MKIDPELMEAICDRAGVVGGPRQVMLLLAEDLAPAEIAERLEVQVGTVYVYSRRARVKIARSQARHDMREWFETLLHELIPNKLNTKPPTPQFGRTVDWGNGLVSGERASLRAQPITVDDLMESVEPTIRTASSEN